MGEVVKNVIILSFCLGIVSLLPPAVSNSKYVKLCVSLVLAISCIVPTVKGIVSFEADFSVAEKDINQSNSSSVVVEKCREKLEEDLAELLLQEFETDICSISVSLDDSDIESIEITGVSVTVKSVGKIDKREEMKRHLSELLYLDGDKILIFEEGEAE